MPDTTWESMFLDPSDQRWMQFIALQQHATLFHHPVWINLIAESYGHIPFIFVVVNKQGEIEAGVPLMKVKGTFNKKRWVSLPYTDHCAPLYKSPEALDFITASIIDLGQEQKINNIELRWAYPAHPKIGQVSNFVLSRLALLPDEQQMIRRIKSNQYRHIRAAYQKGVRVEWGTDHEHLWTFYNLHIRTRRRLGVPVQPWSFFKKLGESIIRQGHGFILLAYKERVCLAAAIFLHWNRTLTYKYGASIEEARYFQAMYPILWTAIRWGGERDFSELDLGRSDRDGHGLRTFKRRWGAEEIPLIYSILTQQSSQFVRRKLIPVMRYIIQKSPVWVCRLSGELLYRYIG